MHIASIYLGAAIITFTMKYALTIVIILNAFTNNIDTSAV